MSKVEEFREAINANEEWQEEVKNFGADDNIVKYASGKGYEFTNEAYSEYVEENTSGELSEFEMELVAGGFSRPDQLKGFNDGVAQVLRENTTPVS